VVGPDCRLPDMMQQIADTQGVISYSVSCDSDDRGTMQAPPILLCLAVLQAGVLLMGAQTDAMPADQLSGALSDWGSFLHLETYVAVASAGLASLLVGLH
jgi:hypothetical protein